MNDITADCDYNTKLCFQAQWYSYETTYTKHFYLTYYPHDGTVEIYDTKCKRIFMRRSASESFPLKNFFIGSTILIYGRQMEIVDFVNDFTRKIISVSKEHTFILVKPSMSHKIGFVINEIQDYGYTVFRMRMAVLNRLEALAFYTSKIGDVFLPFQIEHIISGPVVGIEIVGHNAVQTWLDFMGPDDPVEAKITHPNSLRARFGESKAINAFHTAADDKTVKKETDFFFATSTKNPRLSPTTQLKNTTCCVVKPHVIEDGNLGHLITSIEEHPLFKITAMKMINLSQEDCEEFLEVYKGGLVDFHDLMMCYMAGSSVGLEIASSYEGIDVYNEFRKFVGPVNSLIAKKISPLSLRAMYGVNHYANAVHVTVLKDDTELELEYLFKIMD